MAEGAFNEYPQIRLATLFELSKSEGSNIALHCDIDIRLSITNNAELIKHQRSCLSKRR